MKTINRTAITIRPKQPYIDWPKIKSYKMFQDWFEIICSDMTWDYGTGDIEHEKF